jgi:hypothetical protein
MLLLAEKERETREIEAGSKLFYYFYLLSQNWHRSHTAPCSSSICSLGAAAVEKKIIKCAFDFSHH